MGELDVGQLRILTHYAAGTQLSSIAAIVHVDYDEVVDVVATVARFNRARASTLIRRQDQSRPTAPRIEPKQQVRKPVRSARTAKPTPPTPGPLFEPLPAPPDYADAKAFGGPPCKPTCGRCGHVLAECTCYDKWFARSSDEALMAKTIQGLAAKHQTDSEIGAALGMKRDRVQALRKKHGIPAGVRPGRPAGRS